MNLDDELWPVILDYGHNPKRLIYVDERKNDPSQESKIVDDDEDEKGQKSF